MSDVESRPLPEPDLAKRSRRWAWRVEYSLLLAIVAVIGITCFLDNAYIQKPWSNAKDVLRPAAILGIFALGAGTVILAGGIDLSSGSVIAFSGTICAGILLALSPLNEAGVPDTAQVSWWMIFIAVTGTMLVALMVGTFHAWLITVVGLPPFVATLASLVGLRSLAKVLVQDINFLVLGSGSSTQIDIHSERFYGLADTWWIPCLILLLVAVGLWVLLNRTVQGRHLFALGGNEDAARLSGIRTGRMKWLAYCIGSVTASLAGILYTASVSGVRPATMGLGYELNAIAAAVVGGVSLAGGLGTVTGIVLGAVFLRTVISAVGKAVPGRPDELEGLIVGVLVVLAVAFNELRGQGLLRRRFFSGTLGLSSVPVLAVLAGSVGMVMAGNETKVLAFWSATLVTLVVLGGKAALERRSAA